MKKFSFRRYISTGLALSFMMIAISGIVLYIAPPGRVARWVDWTIIGLNRAQWETQHTLFSYLFILFSVLHLFVINWKVFISYLKSKVATGKRRNREAYFAFATALMVFLLTFFEMPPFISVMDFGNSISDTWENKIGKLPVLEVEDMTLDEIAEMYFGSDTNMLVEQLTNAGFIPGDSDMSLKEIARSNNVSTMKIYGAISLQTRPG